MTPLAVLFDLDNTLVDRVASLRVFSKCLVDHMRVNLISLDKVQSIVTSADGGGYRAKDDVFKDIIGQIPWIEVPTISNLNLFYRQRFPDCTVAKAGLFEMLNWFRTRGFRTRHDNQWQDSHANG
jgi:putative hydrolase of the HAD superfamily